MITNIQLSTKERYLLEDAKTHEEQCILKYGNYAKLAMDQQLKTVFQSNLKKEEEHLQSINQLLSGTVPSISGGSQSGSQGGTPVSSQSNPSAMSQQGQQSSQTPGSNQSFQASDKDLCIDMLSAEKYVSSTYNTAIFEFKNSQVRDVLNHIQTEEQKHGEAIFNYMQSKGMYSAS